ncbi:MAG TPA: hypothetical protein VMB20_12865 [Candidatus Acidoferrum sp.]|nr:hypothetical protein [Candidatus Acidoferrum sp.]
MRHAVLYGLTCVVVIGAEALIVFNWHTNIYIAVSVASVVLEPFFVAIVNAFTYADVRGDLSAGATWLRVLERSWAVLIIGLVVQVITAIGFQSISAGDIFDKLLGAGVIIVAVSLVFADVHATVVDDAEPWWFLVPRSLGASMAVAWQGVAFARALIAFMLVALLPTLLTIVVQNELQTRHVPAAPFWANAVSVLLLLPLVQAFCSLVYLDAIGYEPKRS